MKESFTINKPHIADDFIAHLMTNASKSGEGKDVVISFPASHLNSCLSQLAGDVMRREKYNYERLAMYTKHTFITFILYILNNFDCAIG
jgi:hypothetical protein